MLVPALARPGLPAPLDPALPGAETRLLAALATATWWLIPVALVQGYAWAWVGHFFFEHNKPATFRYPWKSYLGDWRMWWQTLTGKIPF